MNNFADRLSQRIRECGNPTVLGLDPILEYIPDSIISYFRSQCDDPALAAGLALYEFNRRIIDCVAGTIPAVKPQIAYYEKYGPHGMEALRQTIQYAQKAGLLVIADGKRNDIGSTAEAYASAWLGETILPNGSAVAMNDADEIGRAHV